MKKIALTLLGVVVVAGGVSAVSAFEAHIINVTAHIENALTVDTKALSFGTVFPQEYLTGQTFTVGLSDSFKSQQRVNEVDYKIEQKPKCWNDNPATPVFGLAEKNEAGTWVCKDQGFAIMKDLCKFLSKTTTDTNDTSEPSYFVKGDPNTCVAPTTQAAGVLVNTADLSDLWTVDLKVPPVDGFIGQDWPASCASYTVPTDGADYGCDLWVEVTDIK